MTTSKISKQTYYYNNRDEQKLKSLRNYYIRQLKNPDLDLNKKNKYELKLEELNSKIDGLTNTSTNHKNKDKDDDEKRLKSLRYYYVKQLRNPELENDKRIKYEAKLKEINAKISNIEYNENTIEELNQLKADYENKISSIMNLKEKYEAKLQEIADKIKLINQSDDSDNEN